MAGKRLRGVMWADSLRAGSGRDFRYADFHGFPALAVDPGLTGELITSYQTIFGDPDGWAEHYSREDVLGKLTSELAGDAGLRLCLDAGGGIAGFCWAQVLGVDEIADAIGTIKYYQSIGAPEVISHLRHRFGTGRLIYLHDLGIHSRHRGRVPLTQLVYPVLDGLSQRSGVDTVLFWSVDDTNVARLAKRALFHRMLALGDMRFYCGNVRASKTRPRDLVRVRKERV